MLRLRGMLIIPHHGAVAGTHRQRHGMRHRVLMLMVMVLVMLLVMLLLRRLVWVAARRVEWSGGEGARRAAAGSGCGCGCGGGGRHAEQRLAFVGVLAAATSTSASSAPAAGVAGCGAQGPSAAPADSSLRPAAQVLDRPSLCVHGEAAAGGLALVVLAIRWR